MKTINVYIISILIIAFTSIGCVDKNIQQADNGVSPTATTATENTRTVSGPPQPEIGNGNVPSKDISKTNNGLTENAENSTSDNTTEETVPDTSVADNNTEIVDNATVNDTSVTEIFQIGEEKKMLDKNIKLINITDYDNNSVILTVDGVEYKSDSETSLQVGNIEVISVITSEDEKTAEITIDYIK